MIVRLAVAAGLLLAAPTAAKDLRLIAIDVEGGSATLYITPGGKSLLIDTGFPAGMGGGAAPSSAGRIAAAARAAGLTRIDHVMISHYHIDHVGGVAELMSLLPIGGLIDHGPNRENPATGATPGPNAPVNSYARYLTAIAGLPRRQLRAGDRLVIDGLAITAVTSDGEVVPRPLAGAGSRGTGCASAVTEARDGGEENWRSLGVLLRWGEARLLSLGDATLRLENRLACPTDLVGPIDLMFASNHGSDNAGSEALLQTLRPRVVLVSNGPRKGADATVLERLQALPGRPAIWQLHFATRSPAANGVPERIANLDAASDLNLALAISGSGRITITNPRTGATSAYAR